MRRRLVLVLLLATICLLIWPHRDASAEDAVLNVDLCALSPEEYAGRLVQVDGVVLFGFEESSLTFPSCGLQVWLDIPDDNGHVEDKPPAGTRVILGASFAQFQEWSRAGALTDPSRLRWQTAQAAKPLNVVRDRRWRQFIKIHSNCPTAATLIGRLDFLPGPGFISSWGDSRHPFVWQGSGYGHLDAYPMRFVVAQVVALKPEKRRKKN